MKYSFDDRLSTHVEDRRGESTLAKVENTFDAGVGIIGYLMGLNKSKEDKEFCNASKICPADNYQPPGADQQLSQQLFSHTDWEGTAKPMPGTSVDFNNDAAQVYRDAVGYLPTYESSPMERANPQTMTSQPDVSAKAILPGLIVDDSNG